MRAIICAGGGLDSRWEHLGREFLHTPKQLLRLTDDEPTLQRTVRQLRERGVTDIVITAPKGDRRIQAPGARRVELDDPTPNGAAGLNLITGTRPLWADDDRTTIMFGDAWLSDECVDAIVAVDDPEPHYVRRGGPSKLTGHPWDEPFALTFPVAAQERTLEVAAQLVADWEPGSKRLHMWQHYGALWGLAKRDLPKPGPHHTLIDDWSDDIDKPEQLVSWLGRYYRGKLNVAVVIPWRDGDMTRRRALRWCEAWWQRIGVQVVVKASDDPGKHFNVSQARNRGAELAGDWDVVVFADADTLVPADHFWAGVFLAQQSGQVVFPFERYRRLDPRTTRYAMTTPGGKLPTTGGKIWHNHVSGVVMVPRSAWEVVRYDERFVGWGGEDRAFFCAAITLLGEHDRLPGEAVHLWHTASPDRKDSDDNPRRAANLALGARYKAAAGILDKTGWLPSQDGGGRRRPNKTAMRKLLAEPGGPMEKKPRS